MMVLACAIIMLHAIVPHHHDDCCAAPECFFFSEHHHHHAEHGDEHHGHAPFDMCQLQNLLSHLVLSTRQEGAVLADIIKEEAQDFLQLALPSLPCDVLAFVVPVRYISWPSKSAPAVFAPYLGVLSHRGPPMC